MFRRMLAGLANGVVILSVGSTAAAAQVSGRVVIDQAPIAVDIVFGARPERVVRHPRVVRVAEPEVVRYRRGMSLWQLERYLDRIEYEYDLYRHMSAARAYYELGWSHEQLRAYVRWLGHERTYLRGERSRLRALERPTRRVPPGLAKGHGNGHGKGPAAAASHRW